MSPHDETGTIIGYVFPRLTRCPACGSTEWTRAGYSTTGSILYRRCNDPARPLCEHRTAAYKILAIAMHIDRGGDQSEIIPMA